MPEVNLKQQMKEKYAKKADEIAQKAINPDEPTTHEEEDVKLQGRDEIGGRQIDSGSNNQSKTEIGGQSEQNQEQTEVVQTEKKTKKKDGDEAAGFVPSFLLKQQKDEKRESERRAEEAERRAMAAEAALMALKNPPKQAVEEVEPDYATNPDGWYRWDSDRKAREINELRTQLTQVNQVNQTNAAFQHLDSTFETDIYTYGQQKPDIHDAIQFLAAAQFKQNALNGVDVRTNRELIQNGFRSLVAQAIQKGYSPAEYAYAIADAWGYRPNQGGTKAPVQRQQNLRQLNENIRRNVSLGGASGANDGDAEGELMQNVKQGRKELFAKAGKQNRAKLDEWKKSISKI